MSSVLLIFLQYSAQILLENTLFCRQNARLKIAYCTRNSAGGMYQSLATSFSKNVVLARTSYNSYKLGYSFINLLLTSCNQDNSTNFLGVKKMYNEAVRGVYYLRIREKLHGTIRNDNFQRNTSLQHCFENVSKHCSNTATQCCVTT